MLQKLLITKTTSPQEIADYIKNLREQKGKEKQVLEAIKESFVFGHDFVVNLFWEKALTYQHMVMNDSSNKAALLKMQQSIFEAEYYIKKYKLAHWNSRLYRFYGRLSDYKKEYKKAINYYKKAIKYCKTDPEINLGYPRNLELQAFLSYSHIMSGDYDKGYRLAKTTYKKFFDPKEAKALKNMDYMAWGIWVSGITIRTIEAFLDKQSLVSQSPGKKLLFNREEFKNWLSDTEKLLKPAKHFSYRIEEIKSLKEKLILN